MKQPNHARARTTTGAKRNASTGADKQKAEQQNQEATGAPDEAGADAIAILTQQHKAIGEMLDRLESESGDHADLIDDIGREFTIHATLEETVFDPEYRERGGDGAVANQAQVQRDLTKVLLADIAGVEEAEDEYLAAKLKILAAQIRKYSEQEEEPTEGLFAKAKSAGVDMVELGKKIKQAQAELLSDEDAINPEAPSFRSLQLNFVGQPTRREEYQQMDNRSNYRERDDQGRFMSDDDDDRRGGSNGRSSYSSRSSRDDDDRDNGRGRGSWSGDSRGHSEAARRGGEERGGLRSSRGGRDEDDRGMSSRRGGMSSRSSRDDDDRNQGGWFGDSEGHSEAARRGWEERGSSRGSRSSRDDDDDRGMSSRRGGMSSRSSRDDDDRGHGGWFGDSEGHSEAARRGWDERGGSRSSGRDDDNGRGGRSRGDDRSYSSRSSRDDDDRGHGGWFGDSEGHSEAARRGWDERGGSRSGRDDDDRRSSRGRY
jgi:hypothetical protein